MNTIKFQRRAVATAVSAVFAAGTTGVAYAADISFTENVFPKNQGEFFLGAALTKIQIDATGTAEALIEAKINYFDAADGGLGSSVAETDSDGAAAVDINIAVGAPAGVSYAVVTVDLSASSDTVGTSQFAYVDNTGTLVGAAGAPAVDFASEADAIAAAQADPNGKIAVDSTYTGLNIVDAKVDQAGSAPEVVYVTFNADPVGVSGASVGPPNFVVIADNSVPTVDLDKTVSNGAPGTPGAGLDLNQKAFIDIANAVGTLTTALSPFAGPLSSAATGALLDDGAGNGPTLVTTISPVDPLSPPDYAAAGEIVIASGNAAALYDGGTAPLSFTVRMNEEVDAASFTDASPDLQILAGGTDVTAAVGLVESAVINDADGKGTILFASMTAPALFFIDPATGDLLHGVDRESAEPVSVAVVVDGVGTPLALKLNNVVQLTADLAAQQAKAGVAEAPVLITRDSDADGWIDGGTFDFQQDLSGLGAGANLGLVSFTGTPEVLAIGAAGFVPGSSSQVELLLSSPDVPNPDGTAPDTANNDYNGDTLVDATDAAFVTEDNFNTGVDVTKVGAADGVPFQGFIGVDDVAAPTTDLTYASVFDSLTGENLEVGTGATPFSADGAAPVVTGVSWVKTGSMTCGDTEVDYGIVTVQASEDVKAVPGVADNTRDTVNEFRFDGNGPDLLNDAACSPGELPQVEINIGQTPNADAALGGDDDQVLLSNVPASVIGTDLSLGFTGGAVDVSPELPLFVLAGSDANTVGEPEPEGPAIDFGSSDPEVTPILLDGNWTSMVVRFDQDVEAPAGQTDADLNGVFTVRAQVGWDSTGSDTDDPNEVFQWVIGGADVSVGSSGLGGPDTVTLKLPNGEVLPEDTFRVWVDYQGASQTEIDNGSMSYIQNAAGAPAKVDGGTQFDDDDAGAGLDVPIKFTSTGGTEPPPPAIGITYGETEDDEDTGSSEEFEAPFIGLGGREDDQRNLFTQRFSGKVTYDGEPVFAGTAVRADIVREKAASSSETFTKKAVVGDGYIDVRQGSHTDFHNEQDWVTSAMRNKAVTGPDFDAYLKAEKRVDDAEDAYDSAVANNKDSKTIDALYKTWQEEIIKFDQAYFDSRYIHAYVEVTHGEGTKAQDGSDGDDADDNNAMANGNASFGSTVTLLRNIPNVQRNGTRYYPVRIDMENGDVEDVGDSSDSYRNVMNGQLHLIEPELGEKNPGYAHYQVVDTAYALVDEDGNYRVTVGMDESSLDRKSTDLNPEFNDACVLIKVKNTVRGTVGDGEWVQANSCEPSFDSYRPFQADVEGDGLPTVVNVELMNVMRPKLFDDGDFELVVIPGTPARDDSKPLDLPRFFLQARPGDGAPVTLWGHDHGYGDTVAALGLNEGKEPEVQLAFELGDSNDNTQVGSLNLRPGAAIALRGDGERAYYADTNDTGDQVRGTMDIDSNGLHRLFIPATGGPQNAVLKGEQWHLVTFGNEQSLEDITTMYPQIDAMIIFNNPYNDYNAGRDDLDNNELDGDRDTTTWFKGETPPEGELSSASGAFIYVGEEVPDFNVK